MRQDQFRWVLLRTFFQSYRAFHELYARYESRVLRFADAYGVDRMKLELPPEELHSLLDLDALQALRDVGLARLSQLAASVFGVCSRSILFAMTAASIPSIRLR